MQIALGLTPTAAAPECRTMKSTEGMGEEHDHANDAEAPLLDGLLICGDLQRHDDARGGSGSPLLLPREVRDCSSSLRKTTDRVLIREILRMILTERNTTSVLLEAANNELGSQGEAGTHHDPRGRRGPHEEARTCSCGRPTAQEKSGTLLSRFIAEIRAHEDRAVVHYGIPLPADSVLPGKDHQEIPWPTGLLA